MVEITDETKASTCVCAAKNSEIRKTAVLPGTADRGSCGESSSNWASSAYRGPKLRVHPLAQLIDLRTS